MGLIFYLKQISSEELEGIKNDSATVGDLLFSDRPIGNASLDIDKSGCGLHFLLTGTQWEGEPPLSDAVLGGEYLENDQGVSLCYLTSNQVSKVGLALAVISEDQLRLRFQPVEMNRLEIYPGIWSEEDFDQYLMPYFIKLVEYYRSAAKQGNAMMKYYL